MNKTSVLIICICLTTSVVAENNSLDLTELPGLHIERSVDNSQVLVPGLKAQYSLCIETKRSRQETMQKYPYIWESMKETIEPGYDVQAKPDPEPDWDELAVGKFREQEFFYGNKYALYSYQEKYAISEDGLCRLLITDVEKQDLDNGTYRYRVELEDRVSSKRLAADAPSKAEEFRKHRLERMPSPLQGRQWNDQQLAEAIEQQPELIEVLNAQLDDGSSRLPGVDQGISQDSVDKVKKGFGVKPLDKGDPNVQIPRSDDEHFVLGYVCDIAEATPLQKGRVWYWQKMHHYPTLMQRPIILKAERFIFDKESTVIATRFERRNEISDSVFEPPTGMQNH